MNGLYLLIPKHFDVIKALDKKSIIDWKQKNLFRLKILFIYITAPYSTILYRCEVIETMIPYQEKGKPTSYLMKIRVKEKFPPNMYPLSVLSEYGLKNIRGPKRIPKKLNNYINKEKNYN